MKKAFILFLIVSSHLLIFEACNKASESRVTEDTLTAGPDTISSAPDTSFYNVYDPENEKFQRVSNLLEFLARDTMKTDSTYVATLAIAKDVSPADLERIIKDVIDPESKVMVKDTSQEISMQMSAVLEDRSSPNDPNFLIKLIGSTSNVRTYDPKKNKSDSYRMIWQWNVTPLKEGNHELMLSISQVDDNDRVVGSPETRRHSIIIFSEKKKTGFFKSIGSFFGNNWQWMIGAIALPIFIAWFTVRLRRKMELKDSRPKEPGSKY